MKNYVLHEGKSVVNEQRRHIHFVGIGGAGLSALAFVMLARGWRVSGSDRMPGPRLEALRRAGATVFLGHSAEFVDDADLVVVSSAVPEDNPEVQAARARGIPVLKRNQWLAELTRDYDLIAVAGTHGKTTTTAMLTLALADAGFDPTAVIGGEVPQLQGNARVGGSQWFVLEADEYDYAFLGLQPYVAVVTNVEHDHPDIYPTEDAVIETFRRFVAQVRADGLLVACGDDDGVRAVMDAALPSVARLTYGFGEENRWQAAALEPNPLGGFDFVAVLDGQPLGAFRLRVPGRHNVLNALACIAVGHYLGIDMGDLQYSLGRFQGAERRFQPVGTVGRVQIFDDYAHHPSEIRATLQAARERFGERQIWVIFQPHTFSRLAALFDDFTTAFTDADRVYVSDVYAARETDSLGVSAADLAQKLQGVEAVYVPTREELLARLLQEMPEDVVILTLGAGDITTLGPRLRQALEDREARQHERRTG